jgi:protoporphyrinogen/coproporphyrinogen III oxidase
MTDSTDVAVVVVGAGIAGLTAGYELHKLGVRVSILDGASRPGGVIISEEVDGFLVDGGPDALLVQKPEAIALCGELGLGDRLVPTRPPRVAYVQRRGRLHPLPAMSVAGIPTAIRPLIGTRLFSWPGKIRMAAELCVPPRRDDGDESIGSFIARRFGSEAATYLAEPLLAGIHSGDVDRLSVRALFPRFVQAERAHGSVLRAFQRERRAHRPSPDGLFRSLPGGLSELVRALVAALPAGAIRLDSPVSQLIERAQGQVLYQVKSTADDTLAARAVVLAAPAYAVGEIVRPVDRELADLCGQIRYTSTVTVALAFAREDVHHPLNGSGFVVPRVEDPSILAAAWLSSKWPNRAPGDRVLLRTFIGTVRDPDALARTDADLVDRSLRAIAPVLQITGKPVLTRVYRFDRGSAQHEVGHLGRMAAIEEMLARHPGLFVTGSGFRGVGIPDCVADARRTAQTVAAFLERRQPASYDGRN